jgi:hypothetical protein
MWETESGERRAKVVLITKDLIPEGEVGAMLQRGQARTPPEAGESGEWNATAMTKTKAEAPTEEIF